MKLFPEDPVFEIGEVGFDDTDAQGRKFDFLDRKPLGQKLTNLVDRINQPLVIAIDGGWGSGKSHFLKLWTGAHSKELEGNAEVIYFDAFEHDFLDDPLVSLVSRLTSDNAEKLGGKGCWCGQESSLPIGETSLSRGTGRRHLWRYRSCECDWRRYDFKGW